MPLIQVREKAQITLPHKIRKALDIKEGEVKEFQDVEELIDDLHK